MSRWRVWREPAVPMLLAATVVHVVRRDVFDTVLFAGTALLIVWDARRSARVGAGSPGRVGHRWVVAAGMTGCAAVVALAPAATVGARAALISLGLAAGALVLVGPRAAGTAETAARVGRGWMVWAVIGLAACLWELSAFISQQVWPADEAAHPAVSDLLGPLLATWLRRFVFLLLWLGAGWWLLVQWTGMGRTGAARHTSVPCHSETGRSEADR